jgi:hypothetical protein
VAYFRARDRCARAGFIDVVPIDFGIADAQRPPCAPAGDALDLLDDTGAGAGLAGFLAIQTCNIFYTMQGKPYESVS